MLRKHMKTKNGHLCLIMPDCILYTIGGGVYLDTDVLLHSTLDALLIHKCWLAQEDIRYISTGLGFGAEKGNSLIYKMMKNYEVNKFEGIVNSQLDTEIMEKEFPYWEKSEYSQTIGDVYIVGLRDYSKYAKHLATISWKDETLRKKREREISLEFEDSINAKVYRWRRKNSYYLKRFLRSRKFSAFFDNRKNTRIEKIG